MSVPLFSPAFVPQPDARPTLRSLVFGLLAGVGCTALVLLLTALLGQPFRGFRWPGWDPVLFLLFVAGPPIEEWLFRGLPLRLLARRGGSLAAYALLSTLVFAAVHLTGSLPWTQFLVGLTCFFVAARFGWRTSIVTHLTFNSLIFCAVIGG